MADVHTKEVRSYNMSQIRSKNTKPELVVRKYLFAKGFRYRLHSKYLPGKPDIVLPKYRTVIFVHGCFWHGHEGCKYFVVPKTKIEWCLNKIAKNQQLDKEHIKKLRSDKWNVITLFECKLKKANIDSTLDTIEESLWYWTQSVVRFYIWSTFRIKCLYSLK
jgi:DNA mismatch endonuclease (patch repair protein)